jgi:6-methylsalicylate decarboxylase
MWIQAARSTAGKGFRAEPVSSSAPEHSCACCIPRRGFLSGLAALGASALTPIAARAQAAQRIDVHTHLMPPAYLTEIAAKGEIITPPVNWSLTKHLEEMEQAGVTTSILSITTPGVWFGDSSSGRRLSRLTNDYAAGLVQAQPKKLGMFVALPLPDTEGSLVEIAYGLDVLKADGIGLFTSYGDKWLGDPAFDPVFAELNRRKAVVYTHPARPDCCRNLLPEIPVGSIEYATDTTRAIAHWVFSGSARRFPDIKLIWSHAGGTMPFLIERFDFLQNSPQFKAKMARSFRDEIKEFFFDTAQTANPVAMTALKQVVPTSQIVFGTDYPFRTMSEHVKTLAASKVFNAEELRQIDAENIARVIPRYRG